MSVPSKTCVSCGRSFEYRKRWAKNWADVKYCSDECRRNKNRFDYQTKILEALRARPRGSTLSAQAFCSAESTSEVEHVKRSARLLAAAGEIEFLQNGRVVDPDTARGDVFFRLR